MGGAFIFFSILLIVVLVLFFIHVINLCLSSENEDALSHQDNDNEIESGTSNVISTGPDSPRASSFTMKMEAASLTKIVPKFPALGYVSRV